MRLCGNPNRVTSHENATDIKGTHLRPLGSPFEGLVTFAECNTMMPDGESRTMTLCFELAVKGATTFTFTRVFSLVSFLLIKPCVATTMINQIINAMPMSWKGLTNPVVFRASAILLAFIIYVWVWAEFVLYCQLYRANFGHIKATSKFV